MVIGDSYVPDRGHIIRMDFDPQTGHEQAGPRPAVVLSPSEYNGKVGLAIVCPITSEEKGYSFEVKMPAGVGGSAVSGVILADQVKSLDWRERKATYVGTVDSSFLDAIHDKILALLLD